MNLVGKILTVAVLVMSVVFAALTLAVHAAHRNWKLIVDNPSTQSPGLKQIIAERDTRIGQMTTDLTSQKQQYERMLRESEQIRGQLESANAELQKARLALQTEVDTKSNLLAESINGAKIAAGVADKTQQENNNLRTENLTVKAQRDEHYGKLIEKTDELAQATGEWHRHQARNKQLLLQLVQYRQVMQDRNLPLNLEIPTVTGLVTQTHTQSKMVEINLGSDDGLRPGVEMEVYRLGDNAASTRYLGRIKLSLVEKTSAVGNVIPDPSNGTIQKDDHVATRIVIR
jgi:hypothetical protein